MSNPLFEGSVWYDMDVALRNMDAIYRQEIEPLGLNVLEWYIMQTLYKEDGQMATQLANAVGRAPTSFTPILDKLQDKGFIERRTHPADRRAIKVYLTKRGKELEEQVNASVGQIEAKLRQQVKDKDWQGFQRVVETLQMMPS